MAPPFPSLTKTYHNDTYAAINPYRQELSVKGKSVIITGGGSGVGVAIAKSFAQAGAANIAILGRREMNLQEVKHAIEGALPGTKIYVFPADMTDEVSIDNAFKQFSYLVGKINIFCNNAGYLPTPNTISESDTTDWWSGFEINVKGSFLATRAFLKVATPDATIINTSAAVAHFAAIPTISAYTTSKLATLKFFEYVQLEHPEMHVVQFQPGVIESTMSKKIHAPAMDTDTLAGDFAVWLASSEAKYLKGKFVWANWDVAEMKTMSYEMQSPAFLTMVLNGFPSQ